MVVMYQFMSSPQVAIEEEEEATLNKDRNVNYTDVLVTEVTDEGKLYACNVSDGAALEKLMDKPRSRITVAGNCHGVKKIITRLIFNQSFQTISEFLAEIPVKKMRY